jgi:hypothetical protein
MKYLYGASVQGIQGFIFETNKLQEIVGASEIVKSIENNFEEMTKDFKIKTLMNAAGNIKAIFESEEECKKLVLSFGKLVQQKAYGISISQAVVKIEGDNESQEDINKLEKSLKIQRNKPSIALDLSLNIMELNSKTAKPLINKREDRATQQKISAYKSFINENPHLKEFTQLSNLSNGKNKIAVIHADGNGLGMLIPKLRENGMELSEFSRQLDLATSEAFNRAKSDNMSIRDVILGGDDMVVICNANDALKFTKDFLKFFEEETAKPIKDGGLGHKLTACAGIAYSNEKYPFHYAVSLAEELCDATKKHAKKINEELAPSSLMFHNIQSSNFQSWDRFVEDELTITNERQTIRCDFGPYYLNEEKNQAQIGDFINTLEAYRCDGSPISRLRAWLGELYNSGQYASTMLERINDMAEQSSDWKSCIMEKNLQRFDAKLSNDTLIVKKDGFDKTPIYDVLQILSATEAK